MDIKLLIRRETYLHFKTSYRRLSHCRVEDSTFIQKESFVGKQSLKEKQFWERNVNHIGIAFKNSFRYNYNATSIAQDDTRTFNLGKSIGSLPNDPLLSASASIHGVQRGLCHLFYAHIFSDI